MSQRPIAELSVSGLVSKVVFSDGGKFLVWVVGAQLLHIVPTSQFNMAADESVELVVDGPIIALGCKGDLLVVCYQTDTGAVIVYVDLATQHILDNSFSSPLENVSCMACQEDRLALGGEQILRVYSPPWETSEGLKPLILPEYRDVTDMQFVTLPHSGVSLIFTASTLGVNASCVYLWRGMRTDAQRKMLKSDVHVLRRVTAVALSGEFQPYAKVVVQQLKNQQLGVAATNGRIVSLVRMDDATYPSRIELVTIHDLCWADSRVVVAHTDNAGDTQLSCYSSAGVMEEVIYQGCRPGLLAYSESDGILVYAERGQDTSTLKLFKEV